MLLLLGIVLLILGLLVVRGCIRDYIYDTRNAIADDIWDYLCGHTLAIVAGVAMFLIGGCMVLFALNPGSTLSVSHKFPFLSFQQRAGGTP